MRPKHIIIILAVILLIVVGGIFYAYNCSNADNDIIPEKRLEIKGTMTGNGRSAPDVGKHQYPDLFLDVQATSAAMGCR